MLSQYVSIYVPGTFQVNHPLKRIEQKKIAVRVAGDFSERFGGATILPATGCYKITGTGEVIQENILIVKSFYSGNSNDALKFASNIALSLKNELTQESVTIESNDGIDFIQERMV